MTTKTPPPLDGYFVVDTHEGRGEFNLDINQLCADLTRLGNTAQPTKVQTLATGDFVFVGSDDRIRVVFERKTYGDFWRSVVTNHMLTQLEQLGLTRGMKFDGLTMPVDCRWPQIVILLVGTADELPSAASEAAVVGTMSRASINYENLVVLPMSSDQLLPTIVTAHCRRVMEALQPHYTGYKPMPLIDELTKLCKKGQLDSPDTYCVFALSAVPLMSQDKAVLVAAKYDHDLSAIIDAARSRGYKAFVDIDTIGRKTAESLVRSLVKFHPDAPSPAPVKPTPRKRAPKPVALPAEDSDSDNRPIRSTVKKSAQKATPRAAAAAPSTVLSVGSEKRSADKQPAASVPRVRVVDDETPPTPVVKRRIILDDEEDDQ